MSNSFVFAAKLEKSSNKEQIKTLLSSPIPSYGLTMTENGALTNISSGNRNLDFFSMASAKRGREKEAKTLFYHAWEEDKNLALKNLFYLRDVRGGQGERETFRSIFPAVINSLSPNNARILLFSVPTYGRWDDLFYLIPFLCSSKKELVFEVIESQLNIDKKALKDETSVSLMAKWWPLGNSVKKESRKLVADILCKKFFGGDRNACRKTIVSLRRGINVLENEMSRNKWSDIKYRTVPSQAGRIYNKAFNRHDEVRYQSYLESVKSGKSKINTGTLYPYQIVRKFIKEFLSESEKFSLEVMWANLPDYTKGKNAIVVADTSGSMTWGNGHPIDVAVSLALYFSERNVGPFAGLFITFSSNPGYIFVDKNMSLKEKIDRVKSAEWGGSTNILGVFSLIANTVKENNVPYEDVPKFVYIVSDMEFDSCVTENTDTVVNIARALYKDCCGYEAPHLVFWNVNSRGSNVPVKTHDNGATLVSGCSPSIFNQAVEGLTPFEFMNSVLNSDRYKQIYIEE